MGKEPPQDALDLYAWGVEYCEQRGIPLRHIRVRWRVTPPNITERDGIQRTWYYGEHDDDGRLYWDSGMVDVEHAEQSSPPEARPRGFFLRFDTPDEAREYKLTGVQPYSTIPEITIVWVQPGHDFRLIEHPISQLRPFTGAFCLRCDLHTSFEYRRVVLPIADPVKAYLEHAPAPVPPHIQLPACIRRHKPRTGPMPDSFRDPGVVWCSVCRKVLSGFLDCKVSEDPKYSDYIKSLGRCPGHT